MWKGNFMRIYEAKNDEDFTDALLQMMEQDTGKKIFTMRILEHNEDGLESLIVFEDKNILMGKIKVTTIKGKLAIRMQGNYI
jgi:hypothetical protein